jgi:NTE family protein
MAMHDYRPSVSGGNRHPVGGPRGRAYRTGPLKRASRLTVAAVLLLTAGHNGVAAQELDPARPRIALVLSGGGARGAAHLGVLKVLEENRVPIDLIVGNSMGSIIGGLYASGMAPDEMEGLLESIDWKDLFSDRPSARKLSFRHKYERQKLARFEMGLKKEGLVLPGGIMAGQKLGFLLSSATLRSAGSGYFDELPVPFRAVATDIDSGEVVVLSEGSLADAMRASMAIPGVFSPVEIDGRVLVDGGVVNNFPIDIARRMGADVIIAVYVGLPLTGSGGPKSALEIAVQTANINSAKNFQEQVSLLGEEDLLITAELETFAASDFHRAAEIVELGERSARRLVHRLRRFTVSEEEYGRFLTKQRRQESEPLILDFVMVSEPERVSTRSVEARVRTKPGEPLDLETLDEDLTRIYAIGDFEKVQFSIIEEDGQTGLLIDTVAKAWGPSYLRFGLTISDDFAGGSYYTFIASQTFTQLNGLGAEWKTEVEIGQTLALSTEFYQPLVFSELFFVAPSLTVARTVSDVFSDSTRVGQYGIESFQGAFDIGMRLGTWAEMRLGIERGWIDAKPSIGGEELPDLSADRSILGASVTFDQLDNVNFPRRGFSVASGVYASRKFAGADEDYHKLEIGVFGAASIGRHTFLPFFKVATSLDSNLPSYDDKSLGGFLNLSGYREGQVSGNHGLFSALLYIYELAALKGAWADAVYLGASVETGGLWEDRKEISVEDFLLSGSVIAGLDTIFGPLYLACGLAPESPYARFYLFLGHVF